MVPLKAHHAHSCCCSGLATALVAIEPSGETGEGGAVEAAKTQEVVHCQHVAEQLKWPGEGQRHALQERDFLDLQNVEDDAGDVQHHARDGEDQYEQHAEDELEGHQDDAPDFLFRVGVGMGIAGHRSLLRGRDLLAKVLSENLNESLFILK